MRAIEQVRGSGSDLIPDFEEIVRAYEAPISRYLYRMVGEREVAWDLAQETFLSAYRALPELEVTNLSGWLYRIATNHALAHFRRGRRIRWLPLAKLLGTSRDPTSDDHGEHVVTNSAIASALARLDPKDRACLLLKASGFSSREIGKQLGCSEGAARTRLARARESFRRVYQSPDVNTREGS